MSAKIRKPGHDFQLSNEELMNAPVKLLSPAQRKLRRKLRGADRRMRTQRARDKRMDEGRAKVIFCQGTTRKGTPCGSYAMDGAKHCGNHLNEAEKAKFKKMGKNTPAETRAETRLAAREIGGLKMSAPQTARQVMEVAAEKLINRYFKAIGMEFVGFDEEGLPIVYDRGAETGLRLHGESKDGYIQMSKHPDLVAQIQVMEKLMDRVYGKPKQTQILEGGSKPIRIAPVRSVDRAQRVASLLKATGALPHEGRRRSEPSEETHSPEGEVLNVIQLHREDESLDE